MFILHTTWLAPLTSGALAFSFSFFPKYCLFNQPFHLLRTVVRGKEHIPTSKPGSDTTSSPSLNQHPVSTCLEESIRPPVIHPFLCSIYVQHSSQTDRAVSHLCPLTQAVPFAWDDFGSSHHSPIHHTAQHKHLLASTGQHLKFNSDSLR